MPAEPDLRREIADERRELTNAVADLRKEIDQTAERGKRIGAALLRKGSKPVPEQAIAEAQLTTEALRDGH